MSPLRRDSFHGNPDNWVGGFIYFCREDPRVIVPKRLRGFGWTLNFARPLALPVLLLLVGVATLPFEVLRYLHVHSPGAWFATRAAVITGVVWLCVRLSLPRTR